MRLLLPLLLFLLPACRLGPARAMPDPLPEALAWTSSGEADLARPFLGLEVRENASDSLDELFFAPGARVVSVAKGSPAESAGIVPGDAILSLAGAEIVDDQSLRAALLEHARPGQQLDLQVQRGDSAFALRIEPILRASPAPQEETSHALWLVDRTRSLSRLADTPKAAGIVALHEQSPLLSAGLRVGDEIRSVDGKRVHSARALLRQLQESPPGATVQLGFRRVDGSEGEVSVALFGPGRVLLAAKVPFLLDYEHDASADRTSWSLLDFWIIWLFSYERTGIERHYSLLRFIRWSTGVGELGRGEGT